MSESAVTKWVDRLQGITGWRGEGWECNWSDTETVLGVALPSDYKELCRRFGPGYFSDYIRVMFDRGEEGVLSWLDSCIDMLQEFPSSAYDPYEFYDRVKRRGLIQWSSSEWGSYFWLASPDVSPERWPILATSELGPAGSWYRFDISVPEFIFRVISDPEFKPFSIAGPRVKPSFWRYDPETDYGEDGH